MVDGFSYILDFPKFSGAGPPDPPYKANTSIFFNNNKQPKVKKQKKNKSARKPSPIQTIYKKFIFRLYRNWKKEEGAGAVSFFVWLVIGLFETLICAISSHLSLLTLEVIGAPQMTLQQYLSILPCLLLPSGNLQTPFPSIPWCYLPISSVFLSFLLLSLSLAELSSPCQRILRCGHTIWVSVSLPWLGDHHAFELHSGFCWEPPWSSHGFCRKCSEVSFSISSQGLGSFSLFLLSRSSSHRHKGR